MKGDKLAIFFYTINTVQMQQPSRTFVALKQVMLDLVIVKGQNLGYYVKAKTDPKQKKGYLIQLSMACQLHLGACK